jgi:hypothetical protein
MRFGVTSIDWGGVSMTDAANASKRTLLGLKEPGTAGRIVVWDTEEITVGRAPESDLVLEDIDASRHHVRFRRGVAGYEVQDLDTSNGTTVNKRPLTEPHVLQNKDVVRIGELQITFIETGKDPSALGLEVVYASQLKGFAGGPAGGDPGATTLGLTEQAADAFSVGSVGDFGHEPDPAQPAKNLDLEFEDFVPGGMLPGPGGAAGTLTLQLEIEGLTPDLRALLSAFAGKVIELPPLRLRIK